MPAYSASNCSSHSSCSAVFSPYFSIEKSFFSARARDTGSFTPLDRKFLRVRAFQNKPQPRLSEVGRQCAVDWIDNAIEEHLLNPDVIVKIFRVPKAWRRACDVHVQRGRAMR